MRHASEARRGVRAAEWARGRLEEQQQEGPVRRRCVGKLELRGWPGRDTKFRGGLLDHTRYRLIDYLRTAGSGSTRGQGRSLHVLGRRESMLCL